MPIAAISGTQLQLNCYHCGDVCNQTMIAFENKNFCCAGCKNVYELLKENNMCQYYSIEKMPGITQSNKTHQGLEYLQSPQVIEKLVDFQDEKQTRLSFYIPSIHCASCIWLLENLQKIQPAVLASEVNFTKKTLSLVFNHHQISLKDLVVLLSNLGYDPQITLNDLGKTKKTNKADRNFIYKIGIAGFCFGNIMLFSFPEYFHLNDVIDPGFKPFFGYLNLILALPVLVFSASGYFTSAWQGIRHKFINIDIPLALGIVVMFVRSSYEIISGSGAGFMDALAGLVFFLLIGKWFQNKTYGALSFDRDYKSYLPISIGKLVDGREVQASLEELHIGDTILVKNNELIPADGILIKGNGLIDYSFVTGESENVEKISGDKIFAGGKQQGGIIQVQLTKSVSQSYLTQLWNQEIFTRKKPVNINNRVNTVSKYFTLTILGIALVTGVFWALVEPGKIANAVTAVLIITCPCALALTLPFTFGNALRILNRNHLYLKNSASIEDLAKATTLVLDKTGTITTNHSTQIEFCGNQLAQDDLAIIKTMVKSSNHPLSKAIYGYITTAELALPIQVNQQAGLGIEAIYNQDLYKIGSAKFTEAPVSMDDDDNFKASRVYISKNGALFGYYRIKNEFRPGLKELAHALTKKYDVHILSGDNNSEEKNLREIFGPQTHLKFQQTPIDKLQYIEELQQQGKKVLMLGDGLNDAGALKQSDIGIAVTEDSNNFFPACDGMIKAHSLSRFDSILRFSKICMNVMKYSFIISLVYNMVGLSFAVRGELLPVVAAIIMPLSSVSVIGFTVLTSTFMAKKIKL
jgi:Cu+-exporting ATPase